MLLAAIAMHEGGGRDPRGGACCGCGRGVAMVRQCQPDGWSRCCAAAPWSPSTQRVCRGRLSWRSAPAGPLPSAAPRSPRMPGITPGGHLSASSSSRSRTRRASMLFGRGSIRRKTTRPRSSLSACFEPTRRGRRSGAVSLAVDVEWVGRLDAGGGRTDPAANPVRGGVLLTVVGALGAEHAHGVARRKADPRTGRTAPCGSLSRSRRGGPGARHGAARHLARGHGEERGARKRRRTWLRSR